MWWYPSTSNTAVQDVQRHSWKKDLEHCIPNPNVKVTLVQFLERHRCWHLLPNAFWQVSGSAGGQKRLDIGNVDEFRKQLAAQSLSSEIVRYFRNLVFSACCSFAMLRMNPADIWDLPGFAWTYEMIVGLKYAEMHSQTLQRHWWRSMPMRYVCNWTCPCCVRRPAATVDNQSQAGMGREASAEGSQRRNQWPRARALVLLFIWDTLTIETRTLFNSSACSSCFEILHCVHRRDSGSQPWILGRSQHWRPSSILNQHFRFLLCHALFTSSICIDS